MAHSFFLKYGDYRTGMRMVIEKDGHTFYFDHNVPAEPQDEVFGTVEKSISRHFFKRLKELYPEPWGDGISRGERWFLHAFHELFTQVERYKRKYPSTKKSSGKTSPRK